MSKKTEPIISQLDILQQQSALLRDHAKLEVENRKLREQVKRLVSEWENLACWARNTFTHGSGQLDKMLPDVYEFIETIMKEK